MISLRAGPGSGGVQSGSARLITRISTCAQTSELIDDPLASQLNAVAREEDRDVVTLLESWGADGAAIVGADVNASVDGVMLNQVLHHVPDDANAGYPVYQRIFGEFARWFRDTLLPLARDRDWGATL